MKYSLPCVILCFFLSLSFSLFAQNTPIIQDLRDRIPELPTTFPGGITLDPTRTTAPIPPQPPTIISTTPPTSVEGQDDKKAFFIHGFGGTRDKWTNIIAASETPAVNTEGFQARELDALAVLTYPQNGDIFAAVGDVGGYIHDQSEGMPDSVRRKNFLVGHSQGGIVGRFLVTQDFCRNTTFAKDDYYGLVTFGSALDGAQIMNSREDDKINNMATYMCNVLTNAFGSDIPLLHLAIDIFNGDGQQEGDSKSLCQIFEDEVLPLLFSDLDTKIALDYIVGSSRLASNNLCLAEEVHKIAFYGVEPYMPVGDAIFPNPIFYRTVQHFFEDVNSHDYWDADDDSKTAERFSEAAMEAQMEAEDQEQTATLWKWLSIYPALTTPGIIIAVANENAAQAKRDVFRMYFDINDRWMDIIGATTAIDYTITSNSGTSCTCYVYDDTVIPYHVDAETPSECVHPVATDCQFEYNQPQTETYTIHFENRPSDGVVLAESAQYMTGNTHPSQRLTVLYPQNVDELDTGSSHMQMRNDRNARDAFRKLYDGGYDFWFYTPVAN